MIQSTSLAKIPAFSIFFCATNGTSIRMSLSSLICKLPSLWPASIGALITSWTRILAWKFFSDPLGKVKMTSSEIVRSKNLSTPYQSLAFDFKISPAE
jgi:hypothetical protein